MATTSDSLYCQVNTITEHLVEGSPSGILTAEIINWTGKAVVCPRTDLARLATRREARRTGFYILAGPDPEKTTKERVYIGESDNVLARLISHDKDETKDFWNRAVLFISKDENLTKAHVRYLEEQLIRLAFEAGRAVVSNDRQPQSIALPEPDVEDMQFFLSQVRLILPVLGLNFLEPMAAAPQASGTAPELDISPVFIMKQSGTDASAREMEGRFIVLRGSTARKKGTKSWVAYKALRNQLVQDGKLADSANPQFYTFQEDVEFASPSAAAVVVNAGNISGPRTWRVKETSQTYRDWKNERLQRVGVADLSEKEEDPSG